MSKNGKLVRRVLSCPQDLTYDEFVRFMKIFGYIEDDSPNGSRVKFYKGDHVLSGIHKPHGQNGAVMKVYMIKETIAFLRAKGEL